MAIQATLVEDVMQVRLVGLLSRADYVNWLAELGRRVQAGRRLRLVVDLNGFEGWDVASRWEDGGLETERIAEVDRIAFVGEPSWRNWMAGFCKPFAAAEVRFFDPGAEEPARRWVGGKRLDGSSRRRWSP